MEDLAGLSRFLIPAFWLGWLVVWIVASAGVKPARLREPLLPALYNRVPVLVGAAMLAAPQWLPDALTRHVLTGPLCPIMGTMMVFAGLALALWARWHLGRNWSSTVMVKHDHTLIRSGPYRAVRHPIYTGMLLALFGTALAIGAPRGFIGAALILVGFMVKMLAEEARMRETFPAYAEYCRRTARLIPGVF